MHPFHDIQPVALARRRSPLPVAALAVAIAVPGPQVRGDAAVAAPPATDTTDATAVRVMTLDGPTLTFPSPDDPDRPVIVLDDRLEERMLAMAARSPAWARALETLRRERFPVVVGSVTQVEDLLPELAPYHFDGPGATWVFTRAADRPVAAAVTLNLPKLVIRNRITSGDPEQLRLMLELHLAHEIYGHLLPIVRSRDLDHPCAADPRPADPASEQLGSCVMKRERDILVDLGYEPRDAYLWNYWGERIERMGAGRSPDPGGGLPR